MDVAHSRELTQLVVPPALLLFLHVAVMAAFWIFSERSLPSDVFRAPRRTFRPESPAPVRPLFGAYTAPPSLALTGAAPIVASLVVIALLIAAAESASWRVPVLSLSAAMALLGIAIGLRTSGGMRWVGAVGVSVLLLESFSQLPVGDAFRMMSCHQVTSGSLAVASAAAEAAPAATPPRDTSEPDVHALAQVDEPWQATVRRALPRGCYQHRAGGRVVQSCH